MPSYPPARANIPELGHGHEPLSWTDPTRCPVTHAAPLLSLPSGRCGLVVLGQRGCTDMGSGPSSSAPRGPSRLLREEAHLRQQLPRRSPTRPPLIPAGYETSFKKLQYRNLAAEASLQTPAAAAVLRLALFDQLPDPCTWQKQTRASGSGGTPGRFS